MEDVGGSSRAASLSPNYSDVFWRVHDEVLHQGILKLVKAKWVPLEVGIAMRCAIPLLFRTSDATSTQPAVGSNVPEAQRRLGKGFVHALVEGVHG